MSDILEKLVIANNQIGKLQSDLAAANSTLAVYDEKMPRLLTQLAAAREELAEERKNFNAAKGVYDDMTEKWLAEKREIERLRAMLDGQSENFNDMDAEIERLRIIPDVMDQLQLDLSATREELADYKETCESQRNRIANLLKQYEARTDDLISAREERDSALRMYNSLSMAHRGCATESDRLREEIERMKDGIKDNLEKERHASMWCVRYMTFIEEISEKLGIDLGTTPYRNAALLKIENIQSHLAALRAFAEEALAPAMHDSTYLHEIAEVNGLLREGRKTERLTGKA